MLWVISGTAIICEWNQREHVLTFFKTCIGCIGSSPTGKQRQVFWNVYMHIGTNDDLIVNQDLFLGILIYII